jgi:predicted dithiol-disulfide oxidoreductase (DUF899 family)
MEPPRIVSREEWLVARREHLAREKEFTRRRDELSRERRALPWVRVDKEYVFDGPNGKETLPGLFAGRGQLVVYHFMFDPSWDEGCPSCSFWADNYAGIAVHLAHRDTTLVTISRAPIEKIEAFRARMGWAFRWLSSYHTDFNRDYHVTFPPDATEVHYNYRQRPFFSPEGPGISVFARDRDGAVYHTYSCYERGLDMLNGAYHLLDLTPKGRDEAGLPHTMAWVRHHDRYDPPPVRVTLRK